MVLLAENGSKGLRVFDLANNFKEVEAFKPETGKGTRPKASFVFLNYSFWPRFFPLNTVVQLCQTEREYYKYFLDLKKGVRLFEWSHCGKLFAYCNNVETVVVSTNDWSVVTRVCSVIFAIWHRQPVYKNRLLDRLFSSKSRLVTRQVFLKRSISGRKAL